MRELAFARASSVPLGCRPARAPPFARAPLWRLGAPPAPQPVVREAVAQPSPSKTCSDQQCYEYLLRSGAPQEVIDYVWELQNSGLEPQLEIKEAQLNAKDAQLRAKDAQLAAKDFELQLIKEQLGYRTGQLLFSRGWLHQRGLLDYFKREQMPMRDVSWDAKNPARSWTAYLRNDTALMRRMTQLGLSSDPGTIAEAITAAYSALSKPVPDESSGPAPFRLRGLKLRIGEPLDVEQRTIMCCLCDAIGLRWELNGQDQ